MAMSAPVRQRKDTFIRHNEKCRHRRAYYKQGFAPKAASPPGYDFSLPVAVFNRVVVPKKKMPTSIAAVPPTDPASSVSMNEEDVLGSFPDRVKALEDILGLPPVF